MSKKKKKPAPLDDAARARIAERRARKADRKLERETLRAENARRRAEEARRFDPEVIAARRAANQAVLASDAWLVVTVDDHPVAGLLPPAADATTRLIVEDGGREPDEPFEKPEQALLWLYAEAYGPRHPESDPMIALARHRGERRADEPLVVPDVRIIARSGAAEHWLEAARQILISAYRDGTLDDDDVDLFYEFVADDDMRRELDVRNDRDREAWIAGHR